jgi:MFS transporter, AAHS family, benzoate transport protein
MSSEPAAHPNRSAVFPLCWTAVMLDGFDLVVLGTVIPVLLKGQAWGITPASGTFVATIGLLGMTTGAVGIGVVTDYIGRRRVMIVAVTLFSVCTLLCAFANSITVFGLFRFLAGLGLGGCLPTAITLVQESARRGRGSSATTFVMTGYHVGAVLTAVLGLLVLGEGGTWRWMFVIGAAPGLLLAPMMIRFLPESEAYLGQQVTGKRGKVNPVAELFGKGLIRPTLAFWGTSFLGLILVYGLNTWLPQLMVTAGYPLHQGLGLLLTLNGGAIAGMIAAGPVANRFGPRAAALTWFGAGAVLLAALSIPLAAAPLYILVFLTGAFVFSAQILIFAYVGCLYPARIRGTGLGWTAGIGRIGAIVGPLIIGVLLTGQHGYPWGFYTFAAVATLAVAATMTIGQPKDKAEDTRSRRTPARPQAPSATRRPIGRSTPVDDSD